MGVAQSVRQLGSETVVYGISGTLSRFIAVFLVPLYTRVFSPDDYGIISIMASSIQLLSIFVVLGLDNSSARWFYDSQDLGHRNSVMSSWFWCQFSVGLVLALLILALAAQIAQALFGSPEPGALIRIAIWLVPLGTFGRVLGNWLRYQRRPWTTTAFFAGSSLATIGFVILFVLVWRKGLVGLYSGQVMAAILTAIAAAVICRSFLAPHHVSIGRLREMLIFGLPLVPAGIASWVTSTSDRFIVNMFHGTSEVGIYAVSISIAGGVALFTTAFQMAWGPFAFSILNEDHALQVYSKVLSVYALLGCWLATSVSLFAPLLVQLFTTPTYYAAASTIPYLAFSHIAIGSTYIGVIGSGIVKKSTPAATSIFIGAAINTALNFALIPSLGKDGAAISTLIAYLAAAVFLFWVSHKHYPIAYRHRDALICLGFSAALIGLDQLVLSTWSPAAYIVRAGMSLLFIPLAFWLRIARPSHVQRLMAYAGRYIRKATTP
jgi:O-antigen/teichoic acid export membrane protein